MPKVSNEQFVMDFEDFFDTSQANKTELNFSGEDQSLGSTLKADLRTKLNAMQAAQSVLDATTADFKGTRKTAGDFQTSRKKYFGANPAVSDSLKASLNIVKTASGNAAVVAQPLNLSAEGFSSGINSLKWERNGNPSYRIFTVEYRAGETGDWLIAGTTRKAAYNHKNQKPGVKIYYRVFAHTDDEQSPQSNTAVVYV